MIEIQSKKQFLTLRTIWFAERPKGHHAIQFATYKQCQEGETPLGFIRQEFYTKIIPLENRSDSQLMESFRQHTRRKINSAKKEGVVCQERTDAQAVADFVDFYNIFALRKNMACLDRMQLESIRHAVTITEALVEGKAVVMHSNLVDVPTGRARAWQSASHFRQERDSQKRNLTGRANRLLHFEDMKLFRDRGIKIYDLGGYAYQTDDQDLMSINEFKDGFNGGLLLEYDSTSWPLYFYERHLRKFFKKQ